MNKNNIYAVFISSLVCFNIAAQDKKVKKATDNFDNYAYADAIASYEDLVADGHTDQEIYMNLGNANYFNANYTEASQWYGRLLAMENAADMDPDYIYRYAQTLKSLGNYKESDQWMEKFETAKKGDLRAGKYKQRTDYLERIEKNSGRQTIKNLEINSPGSDFAPSINGQQLVFSSARDSGTITKSIHQWNKNPFLDLYAAPIHEGGQFGGVEKFDRKLNTRAHESSIVFTKDGNTAYFTRNNDSRGAFSKDDRDITRLKLYRAMKKDGQWSDITELPFNADGHSVAHPALSPDGSKLYFASDMPGTQGASDIFVVDINADGSFGAPSNLGPKINTEARETFPFLSDSNILYFASDGHPGLGGLDVFATRMDDIQNANIVNIGKPVNSEQDDFSFIIDEGAKKGYFASNRDGGKGDDDIYGFDQNSPLDLDCHSIVSGIARDKGTGEILPGADIAIKDAKGKIIATATADRQGAFTTDPECATGSFTAIATKKDYENGTTVFNMEQGQGKTTLELLLVPYKKADTGVDLAKHLDLEPIYFDLDKWFIRPDAEKSIEKVISYMNQYPGAKIQIGSHTDSRASKAYNMRLSNKRANSTMEHLIAKGIDPKRVSALGFGETMITNGCTDYVKCSKEKHQQNRRSEFILVE